MQFPSYIVEASLFQWRASRLDDQGFPETLDYFSDIELDATGALFRARVTRVDAKLDMAFLDLGDGRTGVLNQRRARLLKKERSLSITDSVQEGEMLTVQAVTDPQGFEEKAITVTPRPRLMGRYVTIEATRDGAGGRLNFSKDLGPAQVGRLTKQLDLLAADTAIIVRGRSAGVADDVVLAEAERLTALLCSDTSGKPRLLHAFSPEEALLLSLEDTDIPLYISSPAGSGRAVNQVKQLARRRYPDLSDRIFPYKGEEPAFETLGVNEAIEEALGDKIMLPSGGWISFFATPALTAVDVNMGSAYQAQDASEAKLMVNMEAALALTHHLKFQNIGGLIVVDFIDMAGKGRVKKLMDLVLHLLKSDPLPVNSGGLSAFGLMTINRAKKGLPLRRRHYRPTADSPASVSLVLDLLRAAEGHGLDPAPGPLVLTGPEPVIHLLQQMPSAIHRLSEATSRTIKFESGPLHCQIREE